MKFFVGLIVGLLAVGGYVGYERYTLGENPCRGHCGPGTVCIGTLCETAVVEAAAPKKKKKRRRRRRRRRRPAGTAAAGMDTFDEPTLKQPTARDLKSARTGPSLKGTDFINAGEAGGGRELSTSEVSSRFRAKDRRIVACIDKARGDYDIQRGKVVVGFRIELSGQVKKVQVTAPAVMQRQGLSSCITRIVKGLRFPRTSRSLVMTFPFALN